MNLFPKNVLIPFSDHGRYDALSDKENLFRQAKKLAIPMPETLFSSDFTSREALDIGSRQNGISPGRQGGPFPGKIVREIRCVPGDVCERPG